MDEGLGKEFAKAIESLMAHPYASNQEKQPHILYLEPESFEEWKKGGKSIELMMREGSGLLSEVVDWASKLPGGIARIAGLLHIMRHAHGEPWTHKVSVADMKSAINIATTLITHALKAFDLLGEDDAAEVAKKVAMWVVGNRKKTFTQRECLRRFRGLKKATLMPGMELLIEHNIIRGKEKTSAPGRPPNEYDVNPYFLKEYE